MVSRILCVVLVLILGGCATPWSENAATPAPSVERDESVVPSLPPSPSATPFSPIASPSPTIHSSPTATAAPTAWPASTPQIVTDSFPVGCRPAEGPGGTSPFPTPGSAPLCVYTFARSLPAGCSMTEVNGLVTRFLDAFNEGDGDAVADVFMDEPSFGSVHGANHFQWFSSGGWDNVDGRTIWDLVELPAYVSERHTQGEHLELRSLLARRSGPISIGFSHTLTRQADDLTERTVIGKGEINCAEQRIYVWGMGG